MEEDYKDLFDEEYKEWFDEEYIRQENEFSNYADEIYAKYITEEYEKYEKANKFVLIYDTDTLREYIIPGTNIHKTESLKDGKITCTSYFKSMNK